MKKELASHYDILLGDEDADNDAPAKEAVDEPEPEAEVEEETTEDVRAKREKIRALLKEYCGCHRDVKEAILCVRDLNSPTYYGLLVEVALTVAFDSGTEERELLSNLFAELVTEQFDAKYFEAGSF